MPITKVVKSGYKSPEQMNNLITYIISEERHIIKGLTGGNMVIANSAMSVYQQMMEVKQYFKKCCGRYMQHIVVSFAEYEMKNLEIEVVYKIAMQICDFFKWNQTVFAIHQETGHIHIHIGVNTVSFLDGSKLRFTLWELRQYVKNVVDSYVPALTLNFGIQEARNVDNMELLLS